MVEKVDCVDFIDKETGVLIEKKVTKQVKEWYSTGEMRTGCNICGFGIQMEKRPHRFDRLWQRSPRLWEKIMKSYAHDLDGNLIGWGDVLDYIGIGWRNPWEQFETQTTLFDMINEDGSLKWN